MTFGWHPREHRKALDGMLALTLEERGAYNTCLDLIYDRQGAIPDDQRWLAGWMGVSARRWSKIRAALIVKGKLFEVNVNGVPSLMNKRAAIEIENQAKLARKLRENGAKGGRKVSEKETKSNEINGEPEALGSAPLKLKTRTYTEEDTLASPNGESNAPVDPDKRAWEEAVGVLVGQGEMTPSQAKAFFGGLLKAHGLQPRDMLAPLAEAFRIFTKDPKSYLKAAAMAREKRQTGPPKRVGFV